MAIIALGLSAGLVGNLRAQESSQALPPHPLMLLPGMRSTPQALPVEVISSLSNHPNPFDSRKTGLEGQTMIVYGLAQDARVTATIFDLLGHRVRAWDFRPGENGARAGDNRIPWDGTNEMGQKVAKGGYIAQIQVETPQTNVTAIRKIGVIH